MGRQPDRTKALTDELTYRIISDVGPCSPSRDDASMIETPKRLSVEHRRSLTAHETPTFFCRPDAPHVPFVEPWMDVKTGDSFEHTELAKHPKAMKNVQLKGAHEAFVAARKANMSVPEALATLSHHVQCPVTCDAMKQPVRAPDNQLYECQALVKAMHTWKAISPSTREAFPQEFTLTVDRNMQQLSLAYGTSISDEQKLFSTLHVRLPAPAFAPNLDAMEAGHLVPMPQSVSLGQHVMRGALGVFNGLVAGLVLSSFGAPPLASSVGGLFLLGATVLPIYTPSRFGWELSRGT